MTIAPPTTPPTTGPMIGSGPRTFVFTVVGVACTVIVDCPTGLCMVCTGVGVVIRGTGVIGAVDDSALVRRTTSVIANGIED